MSHPRKKGGERKDKKNERMRNAVETRHKLAQDPRPTTDQHDIVDYKSGGPSDRNQQPGPR